LRKKLSRVDLVSVLKKKFVTDDGSGTLSLILASKAGAPCITINIRPGLITTIEFAEKNYSAQWDFYTKIKVSNVIAIKI
jgi:hypothetical protein